MNIELNDLGKRFQYHWIFRHLNLNIPTNTSLAITGNNGSGKSTLLKTISGITTHNEGSCKYTTDSHEVIAANNVYKHVSFVAPYQDLIEELSLQELFEFHNKFKQTTINLDELIELAKLINIKNKAIRDYSSGMKQRVKLVLSLYSTSTCILLDEPTSNLDQQGIDWYRESIDNIKNTKTIIISSNMAYEYDFCDSQILIDDFKPRKL